MKELLDYLDTVDLWAVIAVITLIALVLEHITNALERRAYRVVSRAARAQERIQGYAHGYSDGMAGAMPAIRLPEDRPRSADVPEAFTKAFRG